MNQLRLRKKVNVPADRMWEIISSYGKGKGAIPETGCMKDKRAPLKVSGFLGAALRWAEGGGFGLLLGDVSMPIRRSKVGVSVRHAGEEESEVTITMDYTVKYGPLGPLMNLFVMRPLMRDMIGRAVDEIACLARKTPAAYRKRARLGALVEAKTEFA